MLTTSAQSRLAGWSWQVGVQRYSFAIAVAKMELALELLE